MTTSTVGRSSAESGLDTVMVWVTVISAKSDLRSGRLASTTPRDAVSRSSIDSPGSIFEYTSPLNQALDVLPELERPPAERACGVVVAAGRPDADSL